MTIVIFKDQDWWVAQCLEYDIAAQAKTIEDAQYEFQRVFCGRILVAKELGIADPFEDIPRAPFTIHTILNDPAKILKVEFKHVESLCENIPPAYMLPTEALLYSAQV